MKDPFGGLDMDIIVPIKYKIGEKSFVMFVPFSGYVKMCYGEYDPLCSDLLYDMTKDWLRDGDEGQKTINDVLADYSKFEDGAILDYEKGEIVEFKSKFDLFLELLELMETYMRGIDCGLMSLKPRDLPDRWQKMFDEFPNLEFHLEEIRTHIQNLRKEELDEDGSKQS